MVKLYIMRDTKLARTYTNYKQDKFQTTYLILKVLPAQISEASAAPGIED